MNWSGGETVESDACRERRGEGRAERPALGRVFLTGGSGFIGRYALAALLQEGWSVTAMCHRGTLACLGADSHRSAEKLTVLNGDISDASFVREAVAGADAVCHLAAYIPPDYEAPAHARQCLEVNALATLHVAEAAATLGVRLVSCSSAQAYEFSTRPVSETSSLYPARRATYYLVSKLVGELYVEHLRLTRAIPSVTLRVSSCYGLGMSEKSAVAVFMRRAAEGLPLPVREGGTPTFDLVHVTDVANLICRALRSGEPGVYNAGSGQACSLLELAGTVASTFPERVVPIEITPATGTPEVGFAAVSIEKATREWGYRPMFLVDGLADFRRRMEAGE